MSQQRLPKRIRIKQGAANTWYERHHGRFFPVAGRNTYGFFVNVKGVADALFVSTEYAEPIYDEPEPEAKHSQYKRIIRGVSVDVYDILHAFGVTNPATAHAVKKLLRAGSDHNDRITDLREAIDSIERAVELENAQ